jgi:hypothetical protein
MVVLGHWWVISVFFDGAALRTEHALSVVPTLRPATWVFQVMPLLFAVGGFANTAAYRRRPSYLGYLRTRLGRLLAPTLAFFTAGVAAGILLDVAGVTHPSPWLRAVETAAIPVWFLGLYLVVVALAPAMLGLHRRLGGRSTLAILAMAALVIDALRFWLGVPVIGVLNYAFVWLFAHQLGILLHEQGGWPGRSASLAMVVAGLGTTLALTTAGGYPVSMVAVPGEPRWNTEPPGAPILSLSLFLFGLAGAGRPLGERILSHRVVRGLVQALQRRVLTAYLWHLAALAPVVGLLFPLGFPQPPTGSLGWWLWRPVWSLAAAIVLSGLVLVFARLEIHPRWEAGREAEPIQLLAAGFAVFSLAVGVLGFGVSGFAHLTGPGALLLGLRFNPLQNLLHLSVGGILLWAAGKGRALAGWTVAAATALFTVAGAAPFLWPGSMPWLAIDRPGGLLHLVVAGLALTTQTAGLKRRKMASQTGGLR